MLPTDKPMSSQLLDKAGLGRGMGIFCQSYTGIAYSFQSGWAFAG